VLKFIVKVITHSLQSLRIRAQHLLLYKVPGVVNMILVFLYNLA